MSVPTNSTSPTPISVSDPTVVAGETSVVRLGKRIRDWIAALSPAGATVYDTGWQPVALAAGITGSAVARRSGRFVEVYWTGSTSIASGDVVTLVEAGGIPADLRPSTQNRPAAIFGTGYSMHGEVGVNGSITVRNAHSAAIAAHRGTASYLVG